MEARRTADLYSKAEQQLTAVASAVQQQDEIDLDCLSELATAIAKSLQQNDQLLVQALAGPPRTAAGH